MGSKKSAYGSIHVARDAPRIELGDADHVQRQFNSPSELLADFKKKMKINIIKLDDTEIVFDLLGVDAAIANALRRILIAEVPTIAIEKIYIWNNTSIIQDEVLSHRLGLIPILADPREFEYFPEGGEGEATDLNTVVMKLVVDCKRRRGSIDKKDPSSNGQDYINANVYSGQLEWVPQGDQAEKYEHNPIKPVHDDILIAKLKPGQSIALEAHCVKGVGKDHAKFSPVATASYRLQPEIILQEEIKDALADELVEKCPMNVFDIEDLGKVGRRARVARPRDCTMCRECIREPSWNEKVKLTRRRDHFIFSVESVGVYKPEELVREALKVLVEKCDRILSLSQQAMEEE